MSSNPRKKEAGKVSVVCPQCGAAQLESVFAQTTICRQCTCHIEIGKGEEEIRGASSSIFSRLNSLIAREQSFTIKCFNCGTPQTVTSAAKSSICSRCAHYIDLRDFKIVGHFSRNIETQGAVIVTPKGDLSSTKVTCRQALIQGKLRGNLYCTGTAEFKLKERVTGAIEADQLIVEKRSDVEFIRGVKVRCAEIRGKTYARITAAGVVTITNSGWLEGVVYARSIIVERGGVFSGELYIGHRELEQPELLPAEPAAGEIFGLGESGTESLA